VTWLRGTSKHTSSQRIHLLYYPLLPSLCCCPIPIRKPPTTKAALVNVIATAARPTRSPNCRQAASRRYSCDSKDISHPKMVNVVPPGHRVSTRLCRRRLDELHEQTCQRCGSVPTNAGNKNDNTVYQVSEPFRSILESSSVFSTVFATTMRPACDDSTASAN
jgi:hypothetical protein